MHIPDGYLGPRTYVPAFAVMVAFWSVAVSKVKKTLRLRQVPLLALGAAFTFVIMMFNVPIPGGTTGHAVGAVLVAILFGPWAATIVVSIALIVQALIFGDGGITAIGANCFNMAVVCPFVGWWIYRLIAGSAPVRSARHWVGGAVGGWLGLTAAALVAGVEFGIQPLLAHDAAGRALYCPFGLGVAVPAMFLGHFLVFGPLEGVVTALVLAWFQHTAPDVISTAAVAPRHPAALMPKVAFGLGILVLLVPLGLYVPAHFHAGSAWGEWNSKEIRQEVAKVTPTHRGYVPRGMQHAEAHAWKAPMPAYGLPGQEHAPLSRLGLSYVLAGAVGVMVVGFIIILGKQLLAGKDDEGAPSSVDARPDRI